MADIKRLSLLHKVASLYYEKGMKKYDIASEIKQSPTQVGLLLKEAVEIGIVKIEVNLPHFTLLQDRLKRDLGLQDAVVVPFDRDVDVVLKNLSKATAEYFEKNVSDGKKVAVGGGYLTYQMIEQLMSKDRNIDIYPTAIIGRGSIITHIDPIVLVTLLWTKSGHPYGKAHYVTITPPNNGASESEIRKHYATLQKHEKLNSLLKEMEQVDFVFTSVGGLESDKDYLAATKKKSQNLLDELNLTKEKMKEDGGIGDIAYSFFDAKGRSKPEWSIFPNIKIDKLREMAKDPRKRVVVTAGNYKIESLKAILQEEKMCNVLITDATAAETLMKK